jgi:hypothetical protein
LSAVSFRIASHIYFRLMLTGSQSDTDASFLPDYYWLYFLFISHDFIITDWLLHLNTE